MSKQPLHRHFLHYSELPTSQRVLYTAALLVLGTGYLFAMLNIYFTYAGRAGGNPHRNSVRRFARPEQHQYERGLMV